MIPRWRDAFFLCLLAVPLAGCKGFDTALPADGGQADRPPAGPMDRSATDHARDTVYTDKGLSICPPGLDQPIIDSFTITDSITQVPLDTPISLAVKAHGAEGQALKYTFRVSPLADAVANNHDGTGQWRLSTARPVFFSTKYTITAEVSYACTGSAMASASATIKVLGNVLVADSKRATITAVGSNGKPLGQIAGPSALSVPTDLLLLTANELAVGDYSAKLVKVIDLQQGTVVRTFGADAPGLNPRYLDLTPQKEILVGYAKNTLFRYDLAGVLKQTITAPHPYGSAGLTHQSNGSIITGIDGSGTQYAFAADGTSLGLFASPSQTGNTNSTLALPSDDILLGAQTYDNHGRLLRLSKTGAVLETVIPSVDVAFFYLRAFVDGYLFVDLFDHRVFFIGNDLKPTVMVFATLPSDSMLNGLVWLDAPP